MKRRRFITANGLIDGSGGPVRKNVFLEVRDGVIAAVGPAAELPVSSGELIDEFPQCTIVVPLVDCSVSLARSPSVDEKVRAADEGGGIARKAALATQHIRYCYSHGVLGVVDTDENFDLQTRLFREMPEVGMIDIRTAGRDYLRIVYSGGVDNGFVVETRLDRQALSRILQQKGDRRAVVVANGEQPVREALAAGCDGIEQGYGMGADNLRQMAERDVLWIPSVLMVQNALLGSTGGGAVMCRFSMRYVAPGKPEPGAEAYWKKVLDGQLAQLRLARELGVRTAVGTGAGSIGILHGESVVEEIKLFIKAGWPLEEAVRCASVNGAGFFNMKHPGELAAGRPATFLLARGRVQQLPRKLAYLEDVYVNGKPGF